MDDEEQMVEDDLIQGGQEIPHSTKGGWWPLRDGFWSSVRQASGMREVLEGTGTPSETCWASSWGYTFPVGNVEPNSVVLRGEQDSDRHLNLVLGLCGAPPLTEIVLAWDMELAAIPTGTETIWCYGENSATSMMGLALRGDGEDIDAVFFYRPVGGEAAVEVVLTGSGLVDYVNVGRVSGAIAVRVTDTTKVAVELQVSDGTTSCVYTMDRTDLAAGGTDLPGMTEDAAVECGLCIGGRQAEDGTHDWVFGSVAGTTIGNVAARKFDRPVDGRLAEIVHCWSAHPGDLCPDMVS